MRLTVRATFLVAALTVAILSSACQAGPPNEPPGIEGVVTRLTESGADTTVYLIEVPEADSAAAAFVSDKASVTVDSDTRIYDAEGNTGALVTIGTNTRVRVWFEGPVAESYPVQGRAEALQVLGEGEAPPAEDAGVMSLTDADSGSTRTLTLGDTLSIELTSNPTTGYLWAVDGELPEVLQQVGEPEHVAESDLIGAGGTDTWTFKAAAPGSGELKLKYWRAFEPDVAPVKTFTITLTVE